MVWKGESDMAAEKKIKGECGGMYRNIISANPTSKQPPKKQKDTQKGKKTK